MKKYPLVSILIPLYNAERYFSETTESLLAQTYKNIEIIIIDDGSTDNSLNIARQYEGQHEHIKVYTQENSGAQVARNKAFEMSNGEYIQYFDADDIMHPDKISSQIDALREYCFQDTIVATGKWKMFTDSIDKVVCRDQIIDKSYNDKFLYFKDSWENLEYIIGQSWLIPKHINDKIGGWNTRLISNQDGEFFTRVAYGADKIIFVNKSVVYYRKNVANSITSKKLSVSSMRSRLDSYYMYADLVRNDLDKHSLRKAVATLYSGIYKMYYPLSKQMKTEVLGAIRDMGYDKPVIDFKPALLLRVKIFGVEAGLRLRIIRTRLFALLK